MNWKLIHAKNKLETQSSIESIEPLTPHATNKHFGPANLLSALCLFHWCQLKPFQNHNQSLYLELVH